MSKTILITGGSSGIGAACARYAIDAGHKVVLAARSLGKMTDLTDEFGTDKALAVQCDVTDIGAQKAMFEKSVDRFGKIDVVFANAGVGASATGTEEGDPDNFMQMILVNNFAVTVTAKYAIPYLKESRGHLILTGSRSGHSTAAGSVYSATKWFIRGYADNLAAELSGTGVRVTNINPGMVDTPFFDNPVTGALQPEDVARTFMHIIDQPDHVHIPTIQIYPYSKT